MSVHGTKSPVDDAPQESAVATKGAFAPLTATEAVTRETVIRLQDAAGSTRSCEWS